MMKAMALPDNHREGNLHETPPLLVEVRKLSTEGRKKKSSSMEFAFLNRAAASTGVIPTRQDANNTLEYMLSDDDNQPLEGGPAEVEIKAGEKRNRDSAFLKKHAGSLDGEKRSVVRDRSATNPTNVSFVPVTLGSIPVPHPSSPKAREEEWQELQYLHTTTTTTTTTTTSTSTSTTTTPRSPLSGGRSIRRGLSLSLPVGSPRLLPTISPRDLSFVMSDLEEEIERIERSEPKQLTPRCSAPNAVEMAIGGPMVPIALPPQEKKPSGLTKESKKTPPSPTTVCPVTVIPRPQRRPIESIQTSSGSSVWLPKLNLGALGVGDDCPITSPDRSRSVPNILSPRSAFSPRMSPRVGLIPSGPTINT